MFGKKPTSVKARKASEIDVCSCKKGYTNRDNNRLSAISRYGDQNISPDFLKQLD